MVEELEAEQTTGYIQVFVFLFNHLSFAICHQNFFYNIKFTEKLTFQHLI